MDNNRDAMNVSECICEMMIRKSSRGKALTKDELLTYNAALRMLKAIFDQVTEQHYDEKDLNDDDDEQEKVAG
jgi:hypothetical protein